MNTYKRHRFPSDIISHAVWLSHRFNLSYRNIEGLLTEGGVEVRAECSNYWRSVAFLGGVLRDFEIGTADYG